MRVLTTGRVLLAPALVTASVAVVLALPASAGATAASVTAVRTGGTVAAVAVRPGHAPGAVANVETSGVEIGPAVKYVREPDGTVRRVR